MDLQAVPGQRAGGFQVKRHPLSTRAQIAFILMVSVIAGVLAYSEPSAVAEVRVAAR